MYALVTRSQVLRPDDEIKRNLLENVAPNVATSPGFIAAYWLEPDEGGEVLSVVFFENEDGARVAAEIANEYFETQQAPDSLRLTAVDVRRVTASS
jgi:heme-degrading monooxygenase HmoA